MPPWAEDRLAPFGVYPTTHGHVAIVAFSPEWFASLAGALGQPDLATDPRYASRGERMKHAGDINAIISAWTCTRTSAQVVHELLERRGVPCAAVRTPEQVLRDPVLHGRGAVMKLSHPRLGDTHAVGMGLPIRFSRTPSQFDQPAPELGSANAQVYGDLLRLGARELEALQAQGVI